MKKEIHIFTGHFGSGKTEVALNFALLEKSKGKSVTIVDLDIVNPYFRTNDARELLCENGVKLIASDFASSNVDMPTMPLNILSAFNDEAEIVVFDVGGDDDGAYALGRYKKYFSEYGYEMHLVVNTKRPLTRTAEDTAQIAERIEYASGLKITDIYNNTNLAELTDEKTLFSGYDEIMRLSQRLGVDVARNCGTDKALSEVGQVMKDNLFRMKIRIPKTWEVQ